MTTTTRPCRSSSGRLPTTVAEGGTQSVTVTLSADPERTVMIPITTMNQGGATYTDSSGVPTSVTFSTGQTSKSFTFTATQDTLDDDDESVKLAFGSTLPDRVSPGATVETTVNIGDDDDPEVSVSFAQGVYQVVEGGTVTVRLTLSADPERTVVIPVSTTNQDGATAADYSGVPASVTFTSGETTKTFDLMATEDAFADNGESVKLSFGTLPERVSEGSPNEATVAIKQVSTEFSLTCGQALWCAGLRLADVVAVDWGWLWLLYGRGFGSSREPE